MSDKTLPFPTPPDAPSAGSEDATLSPSAGSSPPEHSRAGAVHEKPSAELGGDSRYAIQSELARGGMGRVMVAIDTRLGREVAIKETLRASDQRTVARFWRESLMTARLQHPGIVPVYEIGERSTGEPFLTMRRVQGRPLEALINDARTPEERLRLLPNVLAAVDAVAYAHDRRVIHRDLKPANILVGQFGETVVIDWGLAKEIDDKTPVEEEDPSTAMTPVESSDEATGLTMRGAILGTPTHMPPEQAAGERTDARADVYSLGAVLFQLLTGTPPFKGKSSREVLFKVLTEEVPPLDEVAPWVPLDLASIVKRAMAKKAELRYPTARALADELRGFLSGQLVGSHRYTVGQRLARWTKKNAAALSIAVIALTVLGVTGLFSVKRILSERQAANAARDLAEEKQQELAIEKVRLLKDTDPLAALEAIRSLSPASGGWGAARLLAEEIQSKGAPRWRIAVPAQFSSMHYGQDLGIVWGGNNRFWVLDPGTGHLTRMSENIKGDIEDSSLDTTLFVTSDDNTLRLYDGATGLEVGRPTKERFAKGLGGGSRYTNVKLLGGTTLIAAVADEGIVRMDPARGTDELIIPLAKETETFDSSRDGARILFDAPPAEPVANQDNAANATWLWDKATGRRQLAGPRRESAQLSEEGAWVAWLDGGHGRLERLDGSPVPQPAADDVNSIAFAAGDAAVAFAGASGVELLDLKRPDSTYRHIKLPPLSRVAFNRTGDEICASGADEAAVIDVATGDIELTARRPGLIGASIYGDWLIALTANEMLGWKIEHPKVIQLSVGTLRSFDSSASGKYWRTDSVASANSPNLTLTLWEDEGKSGRKLDAGRLDETRPQSAELRFSPRGELAAWREGNLVHVEGAPGGPCSLQVSSGSSLVAIADDGLLVLLSKDKSTPSLLRADSDKEQAVALPTGVSVTQVSGCGPGALLLLGSDNRLRKLVTSSQQISEVVDWPSTGSAVCTPEGDLFALDEEGRAPVQGAMSDPTRLVPLLASPLSRGHAYVGAHGAMAVWDEAGIFWLRANGKQPFHPVAFPETFAEKASFSPDSSQLCLLDGNGSVWLLSTEGGAPWHIDSADSTSEDSPKAALGCGFAADGKQLLVGHASGDIRVHSLSLSADPLELRRQLGAWVHAESIPADSSPDGLAAAKLELSEKMALRGRVRTARDLTAEALALHPSPWLLAKLQRNAGVLAARMGDRPAAAREFTAYLPMARDADRERIKQLIEKFSQPEEGNSDAGTR